MFKKHKKIYCVHCLHELHEGIDGGKCIIPLCLSGRFTEEVYLHDKCLNPYINFCQNTKRKFKQPMYINGRVVW